uniref:hypothetical protein n=1 Tax=Lactococcus lactis TaxID=1358 RepID=UPI0009C20DE0|nr:hypothetical protein [Lactococcus lactis]
MSIVSSGQITITDLSDGMQLNAFITASGVTTQTYDATAQTWSPSYATTPQVLTLNLTKAGSTSSVIGGVSGKLLGHVLMERQPILLHQLLLPRLNI